MFKTLFTKIIVHNPLEYEYYKSKSHTKIIYTRNNLHICPKRRLLRNVNFWCPVKKVNTKSLNI